MTGRDTGIAARLRAAGLDVVEVAGWQTAGSTDFDPRGSVNHHTAGPSSGATPSLNTVAHGRPDLPGPLCNVLQSRETGRPDRAYVVAAGRANHAGEGDWRGLTGNRSVYGLEIEHTGTSALPAGRLDIAARIHAAMFEGDVANVCQHYEWAKPQGRKIDAATNVPGEWFRDLVRAWRTNDPDPDPEDDDMRGVIIRPEDGVTWYITDGLWKRHVNDPLEAQVLVNNKLATWDAANAAPWPWPRAIVDDLKDITFLDESP